jgi:flagellar hook assembly protein FlgD
VKTNISLEICDITGRVVETLVNGEKEPGKHEVRWDAKGAHSQDDCATGIYFAKLVVGDCGRETKKLISVR